jgi:AraC-like DNA-binding protein
LGNALISCRTLRQAAEFLVRHNPVPSAQASVRFAFDREGAVLSMNPGVEIPGAANFIVESSFAAVVTGIGELVSGDLAGCRIEFTFEPQMPEEIYRRYLHMPVTFGRRRNRLIGPRKAVDLPLVAAGNSVADMYVRQCGKMLRERDKPSSCAAEVRRILLSNRGQMPGEYEVASRLNMSGRTLRRRLMCEATSFRDILDGVRNDFARAYLVETKLSIADVGAILGFEDAANFRRAFRRWNDCSPQDFRGRKAQIVDVDAEPVLSRPKQRKSVSARGDFAGRHEPNRRSNATRAPKRNERDCVLVRARTGNPAL